MSTKKGNDDKKPTTRTSTTKSIPKKPKDDLESIRDRNKIKKEKEELTNVKKATTKSTVSSTSVRIKKSSTSSVPTGKDGSTKTASVSKDGITKVRSTTKVSATSKETASVSKNGTTKVRSTTKVASKDGVAIKRKDATPKIAPTKPSTNKTVESVRTKTSTIKKATRPSSPTSTRVSKSEFYPSKTMYSKALKEADVSVSKPVMKVVSKSTPREKTKSVDKSKLGSMELREKIKEGRSNKKVAEEIKEKLVKVERPRTATLKKGNIVNKNIAGPDITRERSRELSSLDLKLPKPEPTSTDASLENDGYDDDDFDSYASDFDDYQPSGNSSSPTTTASSVYDARTNGEITSSSSSEELDVEIEKRVTSADEERTLDSGNFEMAESKHKQILDNIKENVEKEHAGVSSDEGFEESSLQYINFLGAVKKCQVDKPIEKKTTRGEELMSMISLDSQNVTIFQLRPVSYDEFIKSFGNRHSMQVASQTGDDDINEECQTDLIEIGNKWTQFPTKFTKINETDDFYLEKYRDEYLGAGGDESDIVHTDTDEKPTSTFYNDKNSVIERKKRIADSVKYNENHLTKFILSSGQLVLNIMQESNYRSVEIVANDDELAFSDGFIPLNTNFLKSRPITSLTFSDNLLAKVLSVHGPRTFGENETYSSDEASIGNDYIMEFRSLGCVWNLANPGEPEDIFCTFGEISACCFALENNRLIFGGLVDGTVSIWDLNQSPRTTNCLKINEDTNILLKTVGYSTEVNIEFCDKIVSIQSCYDFKEDVLTKSDQKWTSALQVITLNEVGTIFIWGLISKPSNSSVSRQDQLSLVLNLTISLPTVYPNMTELVCTCMQINLKEPNHIYVATNYGNVLHCLASGAKVNPRKYTPATLCTVKCLASSPHSPEHFLAGYENGNISLFSRLQEHPLMTMCDQEDNNKIEILEWSQSRPCLFYAKDSKNRIHIWDLTVSDLFPIHSVPFKEEIEFLKLSPINYKDIKWKRLYMAIVTKNKEILLHVLNSEHGQQNIDIDNGDMKKFLNYVKLL